MDVGHVWTSSSLFQFVCICSRANTSVIDECYINKIEVMTLIYFHSDNLHKQVKPRIQLSSKYFTNEVRGNIYMPAHLFSLNIWHDFFMYEFIDILLSFHFIKDN